LGRTIIVGQLTAGLETIKKVLVKGRYMEEADQELQIVIVFS